MDSIPVILDTDIGNDPDDLLALAMALDRDEFEVRGIIATGSEPELRARLAGHLCTVASQSQIPIAVGEPVAGIDGPSDMHRRYFLDDGMTEGGVATTTPGDLLGTKTAETVLVTIGPLTTLAAYLRGQGGTAPALGPVVSMGGFVSRRRSTFFREFNFGADPAATRTVLDEAFQHLCVTTNVCNGVYMLREDLGKLVEVQTPARRWAAGFMKEWFVHRNVSSSMRHLA